MKKASVDIPNKTNVRVCIRGRPLNDDEKKGNNSHIVKYTNKQLTCKSKTYGPFDEVFDESSSQKCVFEKVVKPQVDRVLSGYNCTVFAYGQTGTGKTFTMEGGRSDAVNSDSDPTTGMTPRAVEHMFQELDRNKTEEFTIRVSFIELYNEELYDLLAPVCDERERLRLYDDPARKGVVVSGVSEVPVRTRSEVYELLKRGADRRTTAATLMNRNSSRSHSIFTVTVIVRESNDSGEELVKTGKLNLVDLAGSEHIGRSGAEGKRAKEAGNINQSLLTLGRVITSLTTSAPHIPYRESKLTRMLQDSLGGSTITSIIATISPSSSNYEETLSTLEYAMRAKNIKNTPACNQLVSRKAIIKEYNAEIEKLRRDLYTARQKDGGIYVSNESYEEKEKALATKDEEILKLTEKMDLLLIKMQQYIKDMAAIDEQYKSLYNLNERYKYKLQTRVGELDQTRETLQMTENQLSAYTRASKDTYSRAKALRFELQKTREIVTGQQKDAEAWWRVEDDWIDVHSSNAASTFGHADDIISQIHPIAKTLEELVNATNGAIDRLNNKLDEVNLSSSTDIQVIKANLGNIKRLSTTLHENCTAKVKQNMEDIVKPALDSAQKILHQTEELQTAADNSADLLLSLAESIKSSSKTLLDAENSLQSDIDAWISRGRERANREKESREELRGAVAGASVDFHKNSTTLVTQLLELLNQKKQQDDDATNKLMSLDNEQFTSHINGIEELPAIARSFDDVAQEQLSKVETISQEIAPPVHAHKDKLKTTLLSINTAMEVLESDQQKMSDKFSTEIGTQLHQHNEEISSNASTAEEASDRVLLALEDITNDVKTICGETATQVECSRNESVSKLSTIHSHATGLKDNWRKRSSDVVAPSRSNHGLDLSVLSEPVPKIAKLLEKYSPDVIPVVNTRESLLDVGNVQPLSPATMLTQRKTSELAAIGEEENSFDV